MPVDKYKKYQHEVDFIKKYSEASNAASGSKFDANANVEEKNIATMAVEMSKKDYIYVNRLLMIDKIKESFAKITKICNI